jgi:hypoxanthine phosphoribosyltransferase
LEKDVHEQMAKTGRTGEKTQFGIFVLHNKEKEKKGSLPEDLVKERYWAAETIPDLWVLSLRKMTNESVSTHGRREI